MTSMTADAGASTVMDDVVCSAIRTPCARPPDPRRSADRRPDHRSESVPDGIGAEAAASPGGNLPHVREYSTPVTMEPPTSGNLTDDVVTNAREHGGEVVFSRPGASGWDGVTARAFHD